MPAIHFCIDVQKKYPETNPFIRKRWDDMKGNVIALDSALAQRGISTIYVLFDFSFIPEVSSFGEIHRSNRALLTQYEDIQSDFDLSPDHIVAFKTDYSAYQAEVIRSYLQVGGYQTIILSGIAEYISSPMQSLNRCCISTTARDFRKRDYKVVIAAEATNGCATPLKKRRDLHKRFGVGVENIGDILTTLDDDGFQRPPNSSQRKPIFSTFGRR